VARSDQISQHIFEVLSKNHTLTAPQIGAQLKQAGYSYNKTSIYRGLERLLEKKILCRHMFGGQTALYELRTEHHDHLVCLQCRRVFKVPCLTCIPEELEHFTLDHHHLTVFGWCEYCRPQTGKQPRLPKVPFRSEKTE
jgi:Fe2+ or Zn2+ uptake regulation protein